MGGGVTLAVAAAAVVAWGRAEAWSVALPLLLLWAASPAVARWISLPRLTARTTPLSSGDARALRLIARRTWRFFATFVGPDEHALPPDNFQEEPNPVVAHRTSPTNLGLYLLSTVAAHDFGWLGTLDVVERLEATLAAMTGLERFRGHFYNWYDTKDGRPLDPKYVSSVDSGNLAGHLIALAHGCREAPARPRPPEASGRPWRRPSDAGRHARPRPEPGAFRDGLRGTDPSSDDPRPGCGDDGRRHRLWLSLRPHAEAVLARLPCHRRESRPRAL